MYRYFGKQLKSETFYINFYLEFTVVCFFRNNNLYQRFSLPNTEFVIPTIGESLFPMLLLGIGSSGIAFLSFYKLIGDVGSIIGSITIYLVPIFSIFFGYIFS